VLDFFSDNPLQQGMIKTKMNCYFCHYENFWSDLWWIPQSNLSFGPRSSNNSQKSKIKSYLWHERWRRRHCWHFWAVWKPNSAEVRFFLSSLAAKPTNQPDMLDQKSRTPLFEIPNRWWKSNFQLYLFVYIYTPSEPAFHADSNALIRLAIRAKLSELLQFFLFANSSNFSKWLCAEVMSKKRHNYVSFWRRCCVPDMAPQPGLPRDP